jgi:DNA polymerase III sliding clamp (beta) subunit (PCNA family)
MITVDYKTFYKEFTKARKCVGNVTRPILTFIKLYSKENYLYFECTNSYIVWQSKIKLISKIKDIDILLDSNDFRYFPKPAKGIIPTELVITADGKNNVYSTGVITLRLRQFDGKYPNTSKFWKTENVNYKIMFSKKEIERATQGMDSFILCLTPNNVDPAYIQGVSDYTEVNHIILPKRID